MYEYIPEGKRSGMKRLCFGLFASAILLFFASGFEGILYPAVMQTVSVMIIAVTLMLMGRYLLRHYLYRVADDGEGMDLRVDELSRRGRVTVCRLALSGLVAADPWGEEIQPPRGVKIYNYCVEIKPADSWLLEFEDGEGRIYIRLSPDERLKEIFRSAVESRTEGALQ
jgi:hypothetical protein